MPAPGTLPAPPGGAQAVHRALGLLHCFHDNGPDLSASELARRMGLSVSTAHRLARTLVATGFLDQDERTARYRLGPAVAELGQLTFHQRGLHLAAPELAQLAQRTGATADLAIRSGPHAVILVGGSVLPSTGLGLRRPLHSTALGKVLLTWPSPTDPPLQGPLPAHTPRTLTDPAALDAELALTRERGYALNDGESAPGVRTLAVPVLDRTPTARFALAVRSTPAHLTDGALPRALAHARSCARALAVLLLPPDQR
ncbi:IclR family transcriptional regulator [Kitasatospora phosalacinea]|uniref:Glycerol operon regulatory protein n=1 Tax=Kitasatospora phosalacinea TaxID=2065 RepID=A0A9W6UY33_9ACTN|nr:IclR family transcriptional regulator [Kitasatospora phosalacinea]GLW68029.1 IclR family transcriptional regulator [Kitasatospora phosalacinea]